MNVSLPRTVFVGKAMSGELVVRRTPEEFADGDVVGVYELKTEGKMIIMKRLVQGDIVIWGG